MAALGGFFIFCKDVGSRCNGGCLRPQFVTFACSAKLQGGSASSASVRRHLLSLCDHILSLKGLSKASSFPCTSWWRQRWVLQYWVCWSLATAANHDMQNRLGTGPGTHPSEMDLRELPQTLWAPMAWQLSSILSGGHGRCCKDLLVPFTF